jgi:D-3-phosphoglycerate dehydrogenase
MAERARIVIPDDYQDAVRTLACYARLAEFDVTIHNDTVTGEDALAERFRDADGLVLIRERTRITRELLARLPRLKFISQTGRVTPHIDLAACTERGVVVLQGTGSPHAPAELTFALILSAARRIPQEVARLKAGRWQTTLGVGLRGRTLGVFGFGNIGKLVAGYGRAFGMRVLAWGRETTLEKARHDGFEAARSREQFFAEADFLTLHLRLTDETRGIVAAADLARMKPAATLINTSRAQLVAPGALLAALRAGRPGFAALDVFDHEPVPPDDPLLALESVICTPHLGYVEKDGYELYFGAAFDNVVGLLRGGPYTAANPEALARR